MKLQKNMLLLTNSGSDTFVTSKGCPVVYNMSLGPKDNALRDLSFGIAFPYPLQNPIKNIIKSPT
jgi:hypothetical protein